MKEHFFEPASAGLVDQIDAIARRHGSREAVFDDFLTLAVCALAGGTQEAEYLQTVKPYTAGSPGSRSIDRLVDLFAQVLTLMEKTGADILGDIFQGAISRGENGQFFTPDPVCELMAQLTDSDERNGAPEIASTPDAKPTVFDPCCGSGRMLLAAAKVNRDRYFVGLDIDHKCARITALNLALWNLNGRVIWGNTLTEEVRRIYHTGFDGRSFIRVEEIPVASPVHSLTVKSGSSLPVRAFATECSNPGTLFDNPLRE